VGGVYALPFVCLALPGPHSPGVPVPRTRHTPVRMHNPRHLSCPCVTRTCLCCVEARGEAGGENRA